MDFVSFVYAKKLKEAGYKEPSFAPCQHWYNEYGNTTIIGKQISEPNEFNCHSPFSGRSDTMYLEHGAGTYYAPSVSDLMRDLMGFSFSIDEDYLFCVSKPMYWVEDEDGSDYGGGEVICRGQSAADVAAEAWLINNSILA